MTSLLLGCDLVDSDPVEPDEIRLALYAAPATLSANGLMLIGAKLYPGDGDENASFCLRLTAERGSLQAPGTGPTDAGIGVAAHDPGAPGVRCAAGRCLDLPFVSQGKSRVAYATYVASDAPHEIVIGTAYRAEDCAGLTVRPAARATLLLESAGVVPAPSSPRDAAVDPGSDGPGAQPDGAGPVDGGGRS